MGRGLVIRGIIELELYAVVLWQTENLVMHCKIVRIHEHVWNGQVQAAAHAAELERSGQVVDFHATTIARQPAVD
jgi:hypothetical protein